MCVHVGWDPCQGTHVEVRVQLARVCSLFSPSDSQRSSSGLQAWQQVLQSHLTGHGGNFPSRVKAKSHRIEESHWDQYLNKQSIFTCRVYTKIKRTFPESIWEKIEMVKCENGSEWNTDPTPAVQILGKLNMVTRPGRITTSLLQTWKQTRHWWHSDFTKLKNKTHLKSAML